MKPDKWEKQHVKDVAKYEAEVQAIFDTATKEAARIGSLVPNFSPSKPFTAEAYPTTTKKIYKLIQGLTDSVQVVIIESIQAQWLLSNNKNNELCNFVFGDAKSCLSPALEKRYYSNSSKALEAFIERKENGLDISNRIWNYAEQYKMQIEDAIDLALRDGVSAARMSRELKKYLKDPDKLFRRVRDEHGDLHLSKRAKAYNPGAGKYRSSSKNAVRLARTETNMAYRTADYTRWQDMDFVVGIEVHRSNHEFDCSICASLKGKYPKDFKFVGWHPQCRCYATSILKTQAEMDRDNELIMAGGEPLNESSQAVNGTPDNFNTWVKDNKERIDNAKSLPYFLRDNKSFID